MLRARARLFGRAQRRKGINRGRKEQRPEKHMERGGNRGRCREETVGSVAKKGGGAPRKWGTTPRGNRGVRRQETGGRAARKRGEGAARKHGRREEKVGGAARQREDLPQGNVGTRHEET